MQAGLGHKHTSQIKATVANMAPISAKLRQNTFRTICNFQFFVADFFFFEKKIQILEVFHYFRQILEELGIFGRQNRIPRCILLQVVKFSGP